MRALARGTAISPTNPQLVFYAATGGVLTDPFSLSFAIYDVTTEANKLTPAVVQAKTVVNLTTGKLGTGRFAPTWTVPGGGTVGEYEVRWYWKMLTTDVELEVRQPFEVITAGQVRTPWYCLLSDLRSEGFTTTMISDARLLDVIARASSLVERYTGRFFEPRFLDRRFDGSGGRMLMMIDPVIAVEGFALTTLGVDAEIEVPDLDFFRVYNRHLTGLTAPDDRNNPRVELFATSYAGHIGVSSALGDWEHYPRGRMNVRVLGVYGYTDPDGSPFGCTPPLIRRCTQLLALRDMAKLVDRDAREDAVRRSRLVSETTRDQSYTLGPVRGGAYTFTGDDEIDHLLASYKRPPIMGAA